MQNVLNNLLPRLVRGFFFDFCGAIFVPLRSPLFRLKLPYHLRGLRLALFLGGRVHDLYLLLSINDR